MTSNLWPFGLGAAFFAGMTVAVATHAPQAPNEIIREIPTVVREFVREPCEADLKRLYEPRAAPQTNETAAARLGRDAREGNYWAASPPRRPIVDPRDVLIRQRIGR